MAEEPRWGEDTVALGASAAEPVEADEDAAEEPQRPTGPLAEEVGWGEDTVVLGVGDAARAEAPGAPVGRREPPSRRPAAAVLAIGIAVVVVISIGGAIGGNGEQKPAPVVPTVEPRRVEARGDAASRQTEDRELRRADRQRRSERLAPQRRRAREHQRQDHKATKSKARSPTDVSPVPEYAPEPEPEYVPEYAPEPVPEPTPSAEAKPSPPASTPPAVEFGM